MSRVDTNAATLEQLAAIPGVGRIHAQSVLTARHSSGGFVSLDDLVARTSLEEYNATALGPHVSFGRVPPPIHARAGDSGSATLRHTDVSTSAKATSTASARFYTTQVLRRSLWTVPIIVGTGGLFAAVGWAALLITTSAKWPLRAAWFWLTVSLIFPLALLGLSAFGATGKLFDPHAARMALWGLQLLTVALVWQAAALTPRPFAGRLIGIYRKASDQMSASPRLIDLNNASFEQLAAFPGLDRAAAEQIVRARDQREGFASFADMLATTALAPHHRAALVGRARFGPYPR